MAYNIIFRPLATTDVLEAYDWYQAQREGLGDEFLNELEIFQETLQANPHAYSYYDKPVRQGKMNRFPYNVVYEVLDNSIIVYSVFMTSQNPDKKRTV